MSHFVKTKSSMTELELIKKAVKRMGFEVVAENAKVDQYEKQANVALLLDHGDNKKGAVGFELQADGTYSIVGDPYHATNQKLRQYYRKDAQLSQEMTTAYNVEKVITRCEELGFSIEENAEASVGSDGMIHMVAVSYSA